MWCQCQRFVKSMSFRAQPRKHWVQVVEDFRHILPGAITGRRQHLPLSDPAQRTNLQEIALCSNEINTLRPVGAAKDSGK